MSLFLVEQLLPIRPSCKSTIATSSTEAKFIAAVYTAKAIKLFHSVLSDLGLTPSKPTIIYEDNKAAIDMINESKPMARSRHIDVQHFAIQEWQDRGEIEMWHIPGVINPADDETKALSWILHSWHSRHAMGHYGPSNLEREWFGICPSMYAVFRIRMRLSVLLGSREGVTAYNVLEYWIPYLSTESWYSGCQWHVYKILQSYCTHFVYTILRLMYEQMMIEFCSIHCLFVSFHWSLHNFWSTNSNKTFVDFWKVATLTSVIV